MKTISGNLITLAKAGHFDVIVHGANCFHTMGSGIARSIRLEFPQAYDADKATPYGDLHKLGTISEAVVKTQHGDLVVVNAYTQFKFGTDRVHCSYTDVGKCFRRIRQLYTGLRIGYPKIGAGLAGGDWQVISKILDCELEGEDHTLVEFDGSQL